MPSFTDSTAGQFGLQDQAQQQLRLPSKQKIRSPSPSGRGSREVADSHSDRRNSAPKSFEDFVWEQLRGLVKTISDEHSERVVTYVKHTDLRARAKEAQCNGEAAPQRTSASQAAPQAAPQAEQQAAPTVFAQQVFAQAAPQQEQPPDPIPLAPAVATAETQQEQPAETPYVARTDSLLSAPMFGQKESGAAVATCDSEQPNSAQDSSCNSTSSGIEDRGRQAERQECPEEQALQHSTSQSPKATRKLMRSNTPTIHEEAVENHPVHAEEAGEHDEQAGLAVVKSVSMPASKHSKKPSARSSLPASRKSTHSVHSVKSSVSNHSKSAQLNAVQRAQKRNSAPCGPNQKRNGVRSSSADQPHSSESRRQTTDGTSHPAGCIAGDPSGVNDSAEPAVVDPAEQLLEEHRQRMLKPGVLEQHFHHRAHDMKVSPVNGHGRLSQLEALVQEYQQLSSQLGSGLNSPGEEQLPLPIPTARRSTLEHSWANTFSMNSDATLGARGSQRASGGPHRRSIESEIDVMLGLRNYRGESLKSALKTQNSAEYSQTDSRRTSLHFDDGDEQASQGSSNASGVHFETLPIWETRQRSMRIQRSNTRRQSEAQFKMEDSDSDDSSNKEEYEDGVPKKKPFLKKLLQAHYTIRPNHVLKVSWDMFGFVLITYDFVMIPLQFFDPPKTTFLETMVWVVRLYWTGDFPISMFTAYEGKRNNGYERRLGRVWCRYATTWMFFDTLILALDYLEMAVQGLSGLGAARAGKIGKSVRLLRMFRVLRMLRRTQLPESAKAMLYKLQSEQYMIMFGIFRIIILLLGLVHLIACCWYGIGSTDGVSWVDTYNLDAQSLDWRYTTSFHWSLTQFAGSMDIQPHNVGERTFALFALICGFFVSACVVSSITSNMTRLQIVLAHESTQVSLLNRYLIDNGISTKLAMRVQRNAMYAYQQDKKNVPESSIELLQLVSDPLRVELHYEMYMPALSPHPFFDNYNRNAPSAMRRLCHTAICRMTLSAGDILFSAGETPQTPWMYFLTSGFMHYTQEHNEKATMFLEGQWASEAVLWTAWVHHGIMRAKQEVILMGLGAKSFQDIALRFQTKELNPKRYADEFVNRLNETDRFYLSDLSETVLTLELLCHKAFTPRGTSTRSGVSTLAPSSSSGRHTGFNDSQDLSNLSNLLRASIGRTISKQLSKLSVASTSVSRQLSTISNRFSNRMSRTSQASKLSKMEHDKKRSVISAANEALRKNSKEPSRENEFYPLGSLDGGRKSKSSGTGSQEVIYESLGPQDARAEQARMTVAGSSKKSVMPEANNVRTSHHMPGQFHEEEDAERNIQELS